MCRDTKGEPENQTEIFFPSLLGHVFEVSQKGRWARLKTD